MSQIEKRRERAWQDGFAVGNSGGGDSECAEIKGTIFWHDWHDGYYNGKPKAIEWEEYNGTR